MQKRTIQITKRGVQITLGALWLLDGALQLQPQMFTSRFATDVIAPAAQGQPLFVSAPIHLFIHVFLLQPAVLNTVIAVTQLSIGVLLFIKRSVRFGLVCSIVWGLFVWYIGEGLGGLANGQGLLLIGAPGAALIYALLALGSLPKERSRQRNKKEPPAYWLALVWAASWTMGAVYQLLPGQNTVSAISSMVIGNADGAPAWLASLDMFVANAINSAVGVQQTAMTGMDMSSGSYMATGQPSGLWLVLLFAGIQLLVGVMVLASGYFRKVAVVAGIILSLVFWVLGQSLGRYYTGLATDPNTAPLFILLGMTLLGRAQFDFVRLREDVMRLLTSLRSLCCNVWRKQVQ
jgi:hypothetical protein